MSHASGKVKFQDGTIMHFLYDGTSDIVLPNLFLTSEEAWANCRKTDWEQGKDCLHHEEDIEIADDYGYGKTQNGRACRKCNSITFNFQWYRERTNGYSWILGHVDEEIEEELETGWLKSGLPEWWTNV